VAHDPLEDWAEKDRLLAEIGVEPAAPPPAPPPVAPASPDPVPAPARLVRLPVLDEVPDAPPPPALPRRALPGRRHAAASVFLLAVGVAWLAVGAGAGSGAALLAGLAFLGAGAAAFAPLVRS